MFIAHKLNEAVCIQFLNLSVKSCFNVGWLLGLRFCLIFKQTLDFALFLFGLIL